ncbi:MULTISPECIES: PH domain-containing protein [unclassified Lysinibacillus]|uniref:PH domain-containing protein n=1 Tax=unclassified Lysinibacillus TaxID=2636778 RepID=UPI001F0EF754|nr:MULTISPECIES: PH domain-containing protein [unclassified Lysinibacillus]
MVFKSKIDRWMSVIFILLPIVMLYAVITEPDIATIIMTVLIIILLAVLVFGTKYVIDSDELIIYGGIYKKRIKIAQITSLRPTKNPLSAPAMSLDRIEILFDPHSQMTLVSPKDKEMFVKKLLDVNPDIKLVK